MYVVYFFVAVFLVVAFFLFKRYFSKRKVVKDEIKSAGREETIKE
jgi:hypothetical protein